MQQLLAMLAKIVQDLLQKLPYWWKLPTVLMIFYQFQQRDYLMNNNLFDSYEGEVTGPKQDCQDPVIGHVSLGCFFYKKCSPMSYWDEKDGLTRDECVQHCKDSRYPYAGFDHCGKCFCGANFMNHAQIKLKACKTKRKPGSRNIKRGCEVEVFRTINRGEWVHEITLDMQPGKQQEKKQKSRSLLDRKVLDLAKSFDRRPYMFCTDKMKKTRTHDGTCNDLNQPTSGSRFYRFGRNVNRNKTFEDKDLLEPCPRELSRRLMTRDQFIPAKQLNLLAAGWIQFNLHDWFDHGPVDTSRRINIDLDMDDPVHKVHHGKMKIPRTKQDNCPSHSKDTPATFQNDVTHWWDGSQLYGSDEQTSAKLRSFKNGKLKVSDKDGLLPIDRTTGIDQTGFNNNWWVGLSLMHNIFTREHNAICDMLKKYPGQDWDDQKLYDTARLINTAVIMKIHTVEWTPAILNSSALRAGVRVNFGLSPGKEVFDWLAAHNISVSASSALLRPIVGSPADFSGVPFSLTEEFVSVYRMHPLLPDDLHIRSFSTGQRTGKSYSLPEYSFGKARNVMTQNSMDDIVYTFGMEHPGALTLLNYPKALMNLKLPKHQQKGETIDLATIDILRDRERGIPRYNEFRRLTRLAPVESFEKLTPNRKHSELLKELYDDDIEKLDMLIGCLAEEPRPDGFGFGETAFNIFLLMASRRLKTDRFMTDDYTSDIYTAKGLKWIQDTDMSSVLIRAFPDLKWLSGVLAKTDNAFFPWPVPDVNVAG